MIENPLLPSVLNNLEKDFLSSRIPRIPSSLTQYERNNMSKTSACQNTHRNELFSRFPFLGARSPIEAFISEDLGIYRDLPENESKICLNIPVCAKPHTNKLSSGFPFLETRNTG
jgi:hypothetical protein